MASAQKQAAKAVKPVYDQAQAGITQLIPGAEGLYQALIEGIMNQSGQIQQGVVNQADRLGVGRAGLAGDVGALLGQQTGLQTAMLGAQRAGDIASLRQQIGASNVNRAKATTSVGDTIHAGGQMVAKSKLSRQEIEREAKLKLQGLERDHEVATTRKRVQEAEAAARAAAAQAKARAAANEKMPMLQQRKDGGFEFRNYYGETISAAEFAKQAKVPLDQLLKEMAMAGDAGARDVLKNGSNSKYWNDITYSGRWDAKAVGW